MQITRLRIKNFKYIQDMDIKNIEQALILVGKNNTGKSAVLDAVRAVQGSYNISADDFQNSKNIEITIALQISEEDCQKLHKNGAVSQYKRFQIWKDDFQKKLPSFKEGHLEFTWIMNRNGIVRFDDGIRKNNRYIQEVFPKLYFIDVNRNMEQLQEDLLLIQESELLESMRTRSCMFDYAKKCRNCFQCMGLIMQKCPEELNVFETEKLLEYKMCQMNLNDFALKVNECFHKNGGYDDILYYMDFDVKQLLHFRAETYNESQEKMTPVEEMGKGMKGIYLLSLLEAYAENENMLPSIILVEDPELFLHPQLQKEAGEILYRLSKKNQVIFTTYAPNLLFNFNSRQIRQLLLDENHYSIMNDQTNIDVILDDLGYAANDLMNVSFVFIVEGRQDKSRLPLLLEKYYSEIYDKDGRLSRISIITTNSCTNIKTYANLKYINQIYLKDQFLMIRDGDGKDPEELAEKLCTYYEERSKSDVDTLPGVTRKNVLILKYYSFENYFFNPQIMAKIGIVETPDQFYEILLEKWKEYLYRIKSGRHLTEVLGFEMSTIEDIKNHMEEIKIYLRGHNLYDIFYGPFKKRETEILTRYLELAPKDEFKDILDAVERFAYFDSRKNESDSDHLFDGGK